MCIHLKVTRQPRFKSLILHLITVKNNVVGLDSVQRLHQQENSITEF